MEETRQRRGLKYKIIIVWLAIFLMGSFLYNVSATSDPLSLSVFPEVPRQEEPIIVTFHIRNPSLQTITTEYQFYANGELFKTGQTTLAPLSSKKYQYAYENPLQIGEQVNFLVRTSSEQGEYEKVRSLPVYPPQIWSSFVSFASFSTSVMSFMSSMNYYQSSFGSVADMGLNVGLVISIVLIALLIYLELTQPLLREKNLIVIGRLRIRFSSLSTILFIIFMGMVFTKVVMILA